MGRLVFFGRCELGFYIRLFAKAQAKERDAAG